MSARCRAVIALSTIWLLRCGPDPAVDLLVERGWGQYQARDYAAAIKTFHQVLAERPDDVTTRFFLARSYLMMSKYDDALDQIEGAIRLAPEEARLHETLGVIHTALYTSRAYTESQAADAAAAIAAFRQAILLDSSRAGAHYNLGIMYAYEDSAAAARRAFEAALRADSTFAPAFKNGMSKNKGESQVIFYLFRSRNSASSTDSKVARTRRWQLFKAPSVTRPMTETATTISASSTAASVSMTSPSPASRERLP